MENLGGRIYRRARVNEADEAAPLRGKYSRKRGSYPIFSREILKRSCNERAGAGRVYHTANVLALRNRGKSLYHRGVGLFKERRRRRVVIGYDLLGK